MKKTTTARPSSIEILNAEAPVRTGSTVPESQQTNGQRSSRSSNTLLAPESKTDSKHRAVVQLQRQQGSGLTPRHRPSHATTTPVKKAPSKETSPSFQNGGAKVSSRQQPWNDPRNNILVKSSPIDGSGSLALRNGPKTRFDKKTDRLMYIGGRLCSSGLLPCFRHGAVLLRQPGHQKEADWTMRLVVLGGETSLTEEEVSVNESNYFECDIEDDFIISANSSTPPGAATSSILEWHSVALVPPIETLTSHTVVPLTAHDADKCVVFGGSHSASIFSTLYVIDGSARKSYASMTVGKQPAARTEHSCVVNDSIIYIFGGRSRHSPSTPPSTDCEIEMAEGSSKKQAHREGSNDHRHLLHPCKVFHDFWKLNLRDFEWVRVTLRPDDSLSVVSANETRRWPESSVSSTSADKIPRGRAGHNVAVWGGNMFLSGGFDGESPIDDLWCFNFNSEKWKHIHIGGTTPGARYGAASCVTGDRWLIHGGVSDNGAILNDVFVLDFPTLSGLRLRVDVHWDPPKLLPSLAFHSAILVPLPSKGSAVLLIGGYGKHGQRCNAVYFIASRNDLLDAAVQLPAYQRHRLVPPPILLTAGLQGENYKKPTKDRSLERAEEAEEQETVRNPLMTVLDRSLGEAPSDDGRQTPDDAAMLRARVDYLAGRLHEQKFENLQLRTLTREASSLRQRVLDMEFRLAEFEAVQQHPLLGPVVICCLNTFNQSRTSSKGNASFKTNNSTPSQTPVSLVDSKQPSYSKQQNKTQEA